jgi:hypothetical protein
MSVSRRLAVLATALGTVTAGLMSGTTGTTVTTAAAAPRTSAAAPTQSVEVFIRRDNTVVMPAQIRPGVSKFVIRSRRAAGFQIVQAAPGYTKQEAARDINASFTNENLKPFRRFEANLTLLGGMPSTRKKSATMSVKLPEGTYWALDTMPRRLRPAKILTFTVSGESVGGRLSGQVIRATGEHTWGKVTPRIRTQGRLWFQNTSDANHFLEIARLARGKTMKDFRAWVNQVRQGNEMAEPPLNFRAPSLDTGVISGGKSMALKYRLPAGRYVLLCWWPDVDMGGQPHTILGMYRGLRVG